MVLKLRTTGEGLINDVAHVPVGLLISGRRATNLGPSAAPSHSMKRFCISDWNSLVQRRGRYSQMSHVGKIVDLSLSQDLKLYLVLELSMAGDALINEKGDLC